MVAQGFGAADRVLKTGDSMSGTLTLNGTTPLQITTTSPSAGKVWVCSDVSGNGAWATVPASGITVPLSLSGAQASSSILSVTNTTASPSVAALRVFSAASGDRTFGIEVTGDTNRRLAVDSNGKLAWGSGSGAQDVTWYRIATGVVGTDNTLQAGTVQGSAAASGTLTLTSTSHTTKGKILLGTSGYDEVNNRLGVGNSTPNWSLDVAGTANFQQAVQYAVVSKTANYTATASDNVLLVSAASGNVTITLPTAVGISGRSYTIKRTDSTTSNTVTVATTASQTIDGATTYTSLWAQYTYLQVISDGANWWIVDTSTIPDPWHSMSLASQWSNAGAGFNACQYRLMPNGDVEIRGTPIFTSNGTSGLANPTTLATLPSGYLPANLGGPVFLAATGGTYTVVSGSQPHVRVSTGGAVQVYGLTSPTTNGNTANLFFQGTFSL
jgi:hypothetical protein